MSEEQVTPTEGQPVTEPVEKVEAPSTFTVNGVEMTQEQIDSGFMKDKDYRQKTAAVAETRRELEARTQAVAAKEAEINEIIENLQGGEVTKVEKTEADKQVEVLKKEITNLKGSFYLNQLDNQFKDLAKSHKNFKVEKDGGGLYTGQAKQVLDFMQRTNNPDPSYAYFKLFGEDERAAGRKEAIAQMKAGNTEFTESGEVGTTAESEPMDPDDKIRKEIVGSGWQGSNI